MDELTDWDFGLEMRIVWQNCSNEERDKLGDVIRDYFSNDCDNERAERVIFFLQSSI